MKDRKVVIIGGGQAGAAVARTLRQDGFEGSVTIVGSETHPPYERPPLSKDFLLGAKSADDLYCAAAEWWDENDVTLVLGCGAERIDRTQRTVALSDGRLLQYDVLVIATGGRPRPLSGAAGIDGIHTIRTIDDARGLTEKLSQAKSLCVIGGGVLGLEIAASATQMGLTATVLEAGSRLLSRMLPPELSAWLRQLHEQHGISVLCDTTVQSVAHTAAGGYAIGLDSGQRIEVDCLVACIGMEANTELAAKAGLAVEQGIVVDAQCRTSDPFIYAIGDVACQENSYCGRRMRTESWQNAEHQAAVVAAVIAEKDVPATPVPWFWSDQFGKNIQVAGTPQQWDQLVWRGSAQDDRFALFLLDRGRLVGGITVNLGREMNPLRQLIELDASPDPARLAGDSSLRALLAESRAAK